MKILREQKLFWIAIILVLIDQATKVLVKGFTLFGYTHAGMYPNQIIDVIGDTVRLTFVENPGMAFGIEFGWGKIFLSLFSVVAMVGLGWYLYRLRMFSMWVQVGIMLLLAGAVGNLIDRVFYGVFYGEMPLFYGYVVDFIDVDIPDVTLFGTTITRWWIFNIADSCVSCGIVTLLFVNSKIPTFAQLKQGSYILPDSSPSTEESTEESTDNSTGDSTASDTVSEVENQVTGEQSADTLPTEETLSPESTAPDKE
ncbi:MAG: signal peptidase II [Candidatus Kapabacteria bacterium]|nr:signal peptidase II [Candidatus Kapabacteria bacterium]